MQRISRIGAIGLGLVTLYALVVTYMPNPMAAGSTDITIERGMPFDALVDALDNAGLMRDPISFEAYARLTGKTGSLVVGSYTIDHGASHSAILSTVTAESESTRIKVTFPEGVTVRRIASIAQKKLGTDSAQLVKLAHDRDFLSGIGLKADRAEGYLMPDTYFFSEGAPAEVVLKEMASLFLGYYDDARKARAEALDLTPYEAIILASLVEGEARTDEDRAIVAGLYLNRIRLGMLLQADPTIQYVLPDGPRRLLYKDLELDSPYNTYRFKGFPPTPINSPGRASIEAALSPEKSDYIYMVAKADGSGAHVFSTNKRDHDRAVAEYRRRVSQQRD